MKILFLSFTCEDIGVAMDTNMISQLQELQEFQKVVFYVGNFILSIYKIDGTLHGRLGILILSSRAESISHSFASLTRDRYFHHPKIKFVSPRGHVISSIYVTLEVMDFIQTSMTTIVEINIIWFPSVLIN